MIQLLADDVLTGWTGLLVATRVSLTQTGVSKYCCSDGIARPYLFIVTSHTFLLKTDVNKDCGWCTARKVQTVPTVTAAVHTGT
jgi:hypothetical protein